MIGLIYTVNKINKNKHYYTCPWFPLGKLDKFMWFPLIGNALHSGFQDSLPRKFMETSGFPHGYRDKLHENSRNPKGNTREIPK